MANYIKGEDELKDIRAQAVAIQTFLKIGNVEEANKRAVILVYLTERLLTLLAPDAPKSAPVCTCSMDDGIHEWNCALETARR